MRIISWIIALVIFFYSANARADILVFAIDKDGLSYDLSPNNYDNSPSNYDNSSSNYDNSESNYDNSTSNYDNSKSNYDNSNAGNRRLVLKKDNKFLGYYVYSKGGVLNFFNKTGRVAYMPNGGHTRSIFSSSGNEWCGTLGEYNGEIVLGVTQNCLIRFLVD